MYIFEFLFLLIFLYDWVKLDTTWCASPFVSKGFLLFLLFLMLLISLHLNISWKYTYKYKYSWNIYSLYISWKFANYFNKLAKSFV